MPNFASFGAFGKQAENLAYRMNDAAVRKITRAQAERGREIAAGEAARDLGGDAAFSGWRRDKHIVLDTHLKDGRDGSTVLLPTKESAGPWTTAERGRNHGNAGAVLGPGANRRTGAARRKKNGDLAAVRAFKARRWNGYTDPKHTATRATDRMEKELTKIAEDGLRAAIIKHFDVD